MVKGFQFKTDTAPTNNLGDGTITINPNGTNVHNYSRGSGVRQFDAAAVANGITDDFKGGFLDVDITDNYELSDNLSVQTAGNITVTNGVVFYQDAVKGQNIEIGKVDDTKNGQNGTTLRVNFHADATIPGTSNLLNGDFSSTMAEVISYTEQFNTVNRTEVRNGVLGDIYDATIANPTPADMYTISNNIAAPTYQNVES